MLAGAAVLVAAAALTSSCTNGQTSEAESPTTTTAAPMFASGKPKLPQRLLLAHYMPWYQADLAKNLFGWHWTMNHFDPTKMANGKRQIASKHYPVIGPYDSNDEELIDCHVQLMKLAGFDGPIIDWNGSYDHYDYKQIDVNAHHLSQIVEKAGMQYAVLYEDENEMGVLTNEKVITRDQAVPIAKDMFAEVQKTWFSSPNYIKLEGHPLLLSFGTTGYFQQEQWNQIFADLPSKPALVTEYRPRSGAIGGFGWPAPDQDTPTSMPHLDWSYDEAKTNPLFIAPAWPRFDDIYVEAGVHKSWGHIDDAGGKVYEATLTRALKSDSPIIQVATWNDWGEGTEIEPSDEFGYRDLEATQKLRKQYIDPKFAYTPADLRLPVKLYMLRKQHVGDASTLSKLGANSDMLLKGDVKAAGTALKAYPG